MIIPVGLMILIFIESSLPAPEFIYVIRDRSWIRRDDMLHMAMYAMLGFTWCWALRCPALFSIGAGLAWGISTLYGISDEIHQTFVPYRTGELRECVDDGIGAVLGLIAWTSWGWVSGQTRRQPNG